MIRTNNWMTIFHHRHLLQAEDLESEPDIRSLPIESLVNKAAIHSQTLQHITPAKARRHKPGPTLDQKKLIQKMNT